MDVSKLNIGARIKSRRIELGLSVDDIAKQIGKNRATIYRYESSEIEDLPTSILEPLAKALQTTPAYLMGWEMGWENTQSSKQNTQQKQTDVELETLVDNYKLLNDNGKKKLVDYSKDLIQLESYTAKFAACSSGFKEENIADGKQNEQNLILSQVAARTPNDIVKVHQTNLPDLSQFKPNDSDL